MKILLIDNFDSFSWNLLDYFKQLHCEVHIIQNDVAPDGIDMTEIDAMVLSPGPGRPEQAGYLMEWIDQYHHCKPMLGICLGHQALGEYFGMTLKHAIKPMHGKVSEMHCAAHPIYENLASRMNVMRYHSLVLEEKQNEHLEIIGRSEEAEIMSISHKRLPLVGLQYHPESILTLEGLQTLANWKHWISQTAIEKNY